MTQSGPFAGPFLSGDGGEELSFLQDRSTPGRASSFVGELTQGTKPRQQGEVEARGRQGTEGREIGSGLGRVAGRGQEDRRGRERKDARS